MAMIFQPITQGFSRFRQWVVAPPYTGVPWLICLYVLISSLCYTYGGPFTGHMIGFDDQVRMVQVMDLVNGADWYNPTLMRADPPDGFQSIWARIVDIPLAITLIIAQIFMEQRRAALATSVIVSFASLIIFFITARYAARPLVGRKKAWLVALFLMFTSVIFHRNYTFAGFHLGEASHHSWYIILNTLMIGASGRLALDGRNRSATLLTALSIGLFIAVGIEGFPLIAGTAAVLGMTAWLFNHPTLAKRGATALALGAFFGLLLLPIDEAPARLFDVSFAQPSILGPVLVIAAAGFLFAEALILKATRRFGKFASLVCIAFAGVAIGAALIVTFPQMLDGPAAALSPNERHLAATEHPEAWRMFTVATDVLDYIALTAPSVIALVGGLLAVWKSRESRRRRMFYAVYWGHAVVDGVMAQLLWRYIHHAMVSCCLWLLWVWDRLKKRLPYNHHYSLMSLGIFILLGPLWMLLIPSFNENVPVTSQLLFYPAKMYSMQSPYTVCDNLELADYLNKHYSPNTVINVLDSDSASFLFQTNLKIDFLANFPSHDKFIDNKNFFFTQDVDVAKAIARRHQFDLVAACTLLPVTAEFHASRPYRLPIMLERLREGQVPSWLKPVNTGIMSNYHLYAVDKQALSDARD